MPKDTSHKQKIAIDNIVHPVNTSIGFNKSLFTVAPFASLERHIKEYRCIWATVTPKSWSLYLQFKYSIVHGIRRGSMSTKRSADTKLFVRALREICAAEQIPGKEWLVVVSDISIPRKLFAYIDERESNPTLDIPTKQVMNKVDLERCVGYIRSLSRLGIKVVFDFEDRYISTEEWKMISQYHH